MENPLDSLVRMLAVFTDPFPSKTSHLILKMQWTLLSITSACLLKGDHSPSYLYALFDFAQLQAQSLLTNECAKLGLIIKDEIIISIFANTGMISRDGNVSDPDLAFMTTTDLDPICRNVLDDHHVVSLVWDTLKH